MQVEIPKELSAISPKLADILSPSTKKEKENLKKLDLGQLFQWILGFSIVNFDLESGHGRAYLSH
jgi:hypothetical protein